MCRTLFFLLFFLLVFRWSFTQDFILEGCYWNCPGQNVVDTVSIRYWSDRLAQEAPALSDAGFTFFLLPPVPSGTGEQLLALVGSLKTAGLEPITELRLASTGKPLVDPALMANLSLLVQHDLQSFGVNNYFVRSGIQLTPEHFTGLIQESCTQGHCPVVALYCQPPASSPETAATWISKVINELPTLHTQVDPRVLDYGLRESLRVACLDHNYDVRRIFQNSIRDATALSGFNIVTFVNNAYFQNGNGVPNDTDDPMTDPYLAYAYLLTNNQIGLPSVFYADYFGRESEFSGYEERTPLEHPIDQLLLAHRKYIFNSTSIEYLNAFSSERKAHYVSGTAGAGPERALIFQLDGTNTPAGLEANGRRDVIVAINFADTSLQVTQEINMSNVLLGDVFSDIIGLSPTPTCEVAYDNQHNIPNAVYLELPPRSYGVWVQGPAPRIEPSLVSLSLRPLEHHVELTWEVPSETGIKGYTVERSVNERPYEEIEWVDAVGSGPEPASYLYLDEDVFAGEELYYRIKMVSLTGGYEHSTVEETMIEGITLDFHLLQEHNSGVHRLQIKSSYVEEAELLVFNAAGKRISQIRQSLRRGLNYVNIDLGGEAPGVYFISLIIRGKQQWSGRIVMY